MAVLYHGCWLITCPLPSAFNIPDGSSVRQPAHLACPNLVQQMQVTVSPFRHGIAAYVALAWGLRSPG